jgi:3-oxoacyl-[acyl-carrier protein] reductase
VASFLLDKSAAIWEDWPMSLTFANGRKALVTGAGRGIGRAIAMELARHGVAVACVSKNPASCGAVADEIVKTGGVAKAYPCDVADPAVVKLTCEMVAKEMGPMDILVNNAGITADGMFARMTDEAWNSVLQTNLNSVFYFSRALVMGMAKARWGRIINMASVIGLIGNAGQANYAAAKAGIMGLTKSIAKEVGSRGVTVNAVCPGFIATDMTEKLPEEIKSAILAQIPMKRLGAPEEVAHLVAFLASEEAAYITGQSLAVDGGMVTA